MLTAGSAAMRLMSTYQDSCLQHCFCGPPGGGGGIWFLASLRLHLPGCMILLRVPVQSGCRWLLLAAGSTRPAANLARVVVQVGASGQHALTVPVIRLALLEQVAVAHRWCSFLIITVQLCLQQQYIAPDQCQKMDNKVCFPLLSVAYFSC